MLHPPNAIPLPTLVHDLRHRPCDHRYDAIPPTSDAATHIGPCCGECLGASWLLTPSIIDVRWPALSFDERRGGLSPA